MKRKLTHIASIIALTIGSIASNGFAQTIAPGPYYAVPAWDQTLPVNTRFIVLANMNQEAVLDRETGLVWERQHTTELMDYSPALLRCSELVKGNRSGWRLPTNQELRTLIVIGVVDDVTNQLPPGHPFILPHNLTYWTTTSRATDPTLANMLRFPRPDITPGFSKDVGNLAAVWCVRAQAVSP